MAQYEGMVWFGSATGRQRVYVEANTWSGAMEQIKRIYRVDEGAVWDLKLSSEAGSSSGISYQSQNTYVSYDSDLNGLEGFILLLSGLGFFASIVIPQLFTITIILFVSVITHYLIRKVKEELF